MNYREFSDGIIICDLFNCLCQYNKECDNCQLMNEYTEHSNQNYNQEQEYNSTILNKLYDVFEKLY